MIFSPGKLLLTSEYVVLDGALALAVPTKWGQEFFVEEINDGKSHVYWTALHQGKLWLEAIINYKANVVVSSNISDSAQFIRKVLHEIKNLSTSHLQNDQSYKITTNLQFPANFGLGSSSTLMNNLAKWSHINPFYLNESCLGGSGYDIAVAQENSAILFKIQGEISVEKISFKPSFSSELIFIHLNKKQDSREGINLYRSKKKSDDLIEEFSQITEEVLYAANLENFSKLIIRHEEKLANFIGLQPVKEKYFADCPVFVKSLGAWGGDFVMSAKFPDYSAYFREKGFSTVFDYSDIIA